MQDISRQCQAHMANNNNTRAHLHPHRKARAHIHKATVPISSPHTSPLNSNNSPEATATFVMTCDACEIL